MAPEATRLDVAWVERDDETGLAELRAFARAQLYDRAALHADLECQARRARSRYLRAHREGRLIGAASVRETAAGLRVALAAALPGALLALLPPVERPFRGFAAERDWPELERGGGRREAVRLQLVRMRRAPLAGSDARVAELTTAAELESFASLGLEAEDCAELRLGLRDAGGQLVAAGAASWTSERLACLAGVATLPEQRGKGFASAVAGELIRRFESSERSVLLFVPANDPAPIRFAAKLDFRGTRRFAELDFPA